MQRFTFDDEDDSIKDTKRENSIQQEEKEPEVKNEEVVEELTPAMYGRMIRIEGGPLDGYEGRLLSIRGSRVKRLIVEIPGLLVAAVEVDPVYIRLL